MDENREALYASWQPWADEAPLGVLLTLEAVCAALVAGEDEQAIRAQFERRLPPGRPDRAWAMEHLEEWLARAPWHAPGWWPAAEAE